MKKSEKSQKKQSKISYIRFLKISLFGFALFVSLAFFSISSFFAIYEHQFDNKAYPGIRLGDVDVSVQTKPEIVERFQKKNTVFSQSQFTFQYEDKVATASGADLQLGYNSSLMADQALSIGRTGNIFADTFNKARAWTEGITLRPSFKIDNVQLEKTINPIAAEVELTPVDAIFEMENDRVAKFQPSITGRAIDTEKIEETILSHIPEIVQNQSSSFVIKITITDIEPAVTLERTNNLGIKEHIGQGYSKFTGSISNRIHNIALAASRVDGVIVHPGDVFSFNDSVGDISKITGYKEGYVIKDGKTVLGDGGGVCQVSTTIFRAALNAGLPIIERAPHSYRVGYYEQGSYPGMDATVYGPYYDLKFKNDTKHSILVKATTDPANMTLIFDLYGTSDGRKSEITIPVVTNFVPAPDDLYQDDPTLQAGVIKQVDFKAAGATATFSRTVTRNGEVLSIDTFTSRYRPWQAVFLRGTKVN